MEIIDEYQNLENQFIQLRCQLRNLKGKLALFSQLSHTSVPGRNLSAVDQTSKMLSSQISQAVSILDQYELYKEHFYDQEGCWFKILELFESNNHI